MIDPAYKVVRREYLAPTDFNGRQPVMLIWGDGTVTIRAHDGEDSQGVVLTREQVEDLFAKWQEHAPSKTVDIEVPL